MTRFLALAAGLVVVSSVAVVELTGCRSKAHPDGFKPNVLIVLWDTTRADHLSPYGYDKPTTPHLDAFAKEATVYDQATPPGMWTLPTHTAIFTGLTETESGAHASWNWLDNHYQTLAEILGGAGYETFAFSANIIVGPWTNLTQGFEHLFTTYPKFRGQREEQDPRYVRAAREASAAKLVPEDESVEISPSFKGNPADKWGKSVFKDGAPVAAQAFDDFLTERASKDRPFFAYVNMMEAHSPRVPSMASRQAVATPEQIQLGLHTDSSLYALNEYIVGKREYTDEQKAAITAIYDAALHDLDDATQTIFDSLKTHGVLDDTVVIVMADHGEALGEHRRYEHRWSVYQQLLHVPLVIRYPEKFPAGQRVAQRVSTGDVFATVHELAGLPIPSTTRFHSLVGRKDFDKFVFSQLLDPFAQQLASMEEAYPELVTSGAIAEWQQSYCAAFEDDWKLIYATHSSNLLFDLAKDPGETTNLYDEPADLEQRHELEKALYDFESHLAPYDPNQRDKLEKLRQVVLDRAAAKMGAAKDGGADAADDRTTAMLKDLGYAAPDSAGLPWRDYCGPFGIPKEERSDDLQALLGDLPAAPPPIVNVAREQEKERQAAKQAAGDAAPADAAKAKAGSKAPPRHR